MSVIKYKKFGEDDMDEIKKIDCKASNPWSARWFNEKLSVTIDGENVLLTFRESIVKIDVKGKAICTWCNNKVLNYGGNGKGNILTHLATDHHIFLSLSRHASYLFN